MVETWLPYGKTEVAVKIPNENLMKVVDPQEKAGVANPSEEFLRALENPLRSQKLDEVAKAGKKVAIVIDDKTRPAPSRLMIPCLLGKLEGLGVRAEDVTIIVGCGAHPASLEEAVALVGDEVAKRVRLAVHDCNAGDLAYLGVTKLGTKVYVNKVFAEADLRIVTGDIGFHYFAGYSGGRKSVLPGISGLSSIQSNHALLLNPKARTGNLEENPVHVDMAEAAHLARVDFALNVVINSKNEVVKAFAGDIDQVFMEGVKLVDEAGKVPVEAPADIVISSPGGYPYDLSLYHAYRGVDSVLDVVKDDGVIILVAECLEGYGNKVFYDWTVKFKSLIDVEREVKKSFMVGGHVAYYLMKATERVKIILVSIMPDYYAKGVFRLRTEKTLNLALNSAFRITGRKGRILVVPHAAVTLPTIRK